MIRLLRSRDGRAIRFSFVSDPGVRVDGVEAVSMAIDDPIEKIREQLRDSGFDGLSGSLQVAGLTDPE